MGVKFLILKKQERLLIINPDNDCAKKCRCGSSFEENSKVFHFFKEVLPLLYKMAKLWNSEKYLEKS